MSFMRLPRLRAFRVGLIAVAAGLGPMPSAEAEAQIIEAQMPAAAVECMRFQDLKIAPPDPARRIAPPLSTAILKRLDAPPEAEVFFLADPPYVDGMLVVLFNDCILTAQQLSLQDLTLILRGN